MKTKYHCYTEDNKYIFENGFVMKRENGKTPNGNELNGRWVLRDENGDFIDFDQYRHDLADRHNLYI